MWTRAELKERAKGCLRQYYWAAFLVSLIFSIIGGLGGVNIDSVIPSVCCDVIIRLK